MSIKEESSSSVTTLIESAKKNVAEAEKAVARKEQLERKMEEIVATETSISTEIEECDKTIKVLLGGNRIIKKVDNSIDSIPVKRGRGRPSKVINSMTLKKMTLAGAVTMVMTSNKKAMKVKDIAKEVLNIGYKTKIKNSTYFASSVNKILREDKDMKKVSHGVFQYSPKRTKIKAKSA
jgi:hypothetical protein